MSFYLVRLPHCLYIDVHFLYKMFVCLYLDNHDYYMKYSQYLKYSHKQFLSQ